MDELDYMGDNDYTTVAAIANERADIGITASSTPTGRRSTFYRMCLGPTDPNGLGYTHWHIPSQRSPLWSDDMEDRARAEYNQQQYEHEILAEFGTEITGVFDKEAVDAATKELWYTYTALTPTQQRSIPQGVKPLQFIFAKGDRAPQNLYRTVGVDFDKFGAGSSIVVLDYDPKIQKFWVMNRIEIPRGEYTYSNAVQQVINVNEIYDPRWIFCDAGSGETI